MFTFFFMQSLEIIVNVCDSSLLGARFKVSFKSVNYASKLRNGTNI